MQAHSFQRHTFFLLWLLCSAVASRLLNHEVKDITPDTEINPSLARRQSDDGETFAVTGITDAGVQPRLEIREMERDADMWNIYLLGMRRFQDTDQSNKFSYYRICGIHGRPFEPWDDVETTTDGQVGYCTHVSNIFLSWHRPYLALYEQTLFEHIIDAVNDFPAGSVRSRYAAVAMRWRMPYWDWAVVPESGSVYPDSLKTPTIQVTLPNGTATISNPLYSYRFHPVSAADFFFNPYASWNETKRHPTALSASAPSENQLVGDTLDNMRNSLMNRLYNLFVNYDNFTLFSNEEWMTGNIQNADSLESIHDVIHGTLGGNGHMTYQDYSAFDPVFFLHHTMLDRCLALWQAIYGEDRYVQPMPAKYETFTIKMGEMIDVNTPLTPFHSDTNGTMHTSATVVKTADFGYTYKEVAGNASRASVIAAINNLYGSNAVSGGPLVQRTLRVSQAATEQEVKSAPGEIVDGRYRHYTANIVSQKFAVNGTYAIYIFLGDVQDEDSAKWQLSSNLVGTHAVFAGLTSDDTSISKMPAGYGSALVTGAIPLTDGLIQKVQAGDLAGMTGESVEDYLQKNLQWRVAMMDGTPINADDVADLAITVVSAEVEPAAAIDQFPSWHNFNELTSITHGQPGGHKD